MQDRRPNPFFCHPLCLGLIAGKQQGWGSCSRKEWWEIQFFRRALFGVGFTKRLKLPEFFSSREW